MAGDTRTVAVDGVLHKASVRRRPAVAAEREFLGCITTPCSSRPVVDRRMPEGIMSCGEGRLPRRWPSTP